MYYGQIKNISDSDSTYITHAATLHYLMEKILVMTPVIQFFPNTYWAAALYRNLKTGTIVLGLRKDL